MRGSFPALCRWSMLYSSADVAQEKTRDRTTQQLADFPETHHGAQPQRLRPLFREPLPELEVLVVRGERQQEGRRLLPRPRRRRHRARLTHQRQRAQDDADRRARGQDRRAGKEEQLRQQRDGQQCRYSG